MQSMGHLYYLKIVSSLYSEQVLKFPIEIHEIDSECFAIPMNFCLT